MLTIAGKRDTQVTNQSNSGPESKLRQGPASCIGVRLIGNIVPEFEFLLGLKYHLQAVIGMIGPGDADIVTLRFEGAIQRACRFHA